MRKTPSGSRSASTPLEGRSSRFEPASPDLPKIVGVLNRIGALALPEVAEGWAETRWNRFAEDAVDASLFEDGALLYTDINPSNLMIGDQAPRRPRGRVAAGARVEPPDPFGAARVWPLTRAG